MNNFVIFEVNITIMLLYISTNLAAILSENFALIDSVNTYYESAWSKLIIAGTLLVAIVGFIIPILMQWNQSYSLKISEKSLKNYVELEVSKVKGELETAIENKFSEQVTELKAELKRIESQTKGQVFHLQGNTSLGYNDELQATKDFLAAGIYYSEAGDMINLQEVLRTLISKLLPKLDEDQLDEIEIEEFGVKSLIESLEQIDINGSITRLIRELKIAEHKIRKTKDKSRSTEEVK